MRTDTDVRPVPPTIAAAPPRRRLLRWRWLVVALLVPLAVAAGGLWFFVLRHHAPPPTSLDQALAGIEAPAGPAAPADPASGAAPTAPPAAASAVDGTWSVDRTITNAQGTGSYTGFRVDEVLSGIGSSTAVGRTSTVEGTLTVQGSTLTAATVNANLTRVTSNDSRRDSAIQRALDTSRYPNATFVLTTPVDVGSVPAEGQRITAAATGDLTIHGVTRQVTIDLQAQLQNGVLVVVGSTDVSFSDFNVTAPTAPIVASVDDHGVVELQLYFVKQ
jgi:polyisoprenoid-binding protein YceI